MAVLQGVGYAAKNMLRFRVSCRRLIRQGKSPTRALRSRGAKAPRPFGHRCLRLFVMQGDGRCGRTARSRVCCKKHAAFPRVLQAADSPRKEPTRALRSRGAKAPRPFGHKALSLAASLQDTAEASQLFFAAYPTPCSTTSFISPCMIIRLRGDRS